MVFFGHFVPYRSVNTYIHCCCLGITSRAQLFKKRAWRLLLLGDKAPSIARESSEIAHKLNQRCYLNTGKGGCFFLTPKDGGDKWPSMGARLSSSLSLAVELVIQEGTMDFALSTLKEAHCHASRFVL